MSELKEKALSKMLEEMNNEHTQIEDTIHNWLCNQDDEKILLGILNEGRSIKGAVKYMASLAKKSIDGNMAVVDDSTGFGWIRDYFIAETIEEIKDLHFEVRSAVKEHSKAINKKRKTNNSFKENDEQISLFDDLEELL